MAERKTVKILDIRESELWLVCTKKLQDDCNPYRLYKKYYVPGKGYRQTQIAKYSDFMSVLNAIRSVYTAIAVLK
jgi:hypothetical protein